MIRVSRTLAARRDLMTHASYLAEQSRSVAVAERFIDRINERISMCAQFPEMGELCPRLGAGVRRVIVGSYLIFYEKTPSGIRILRILHSSQDLTTAW